MMADKTMELSPEFMAVAYAESRDGLHFTKPVLGLVEWNGSKANNLVFPTDPKMMAVGGIFACMTFGVAS